MSHPYRAMQVLPEPKPALADELRETADGAVARRVGRIVKRTIRRARRSAKQGFKTLPAFYLEAEIATHLARILESQNFEVLLGGVDCDGDRRVRVSWSGES